MVRTIIFALILVSSVAAQSPRLDSIQVAVVEQLGLASSSGTAHAINRAYNQVCSDYPALEKIDTITVDSATGYATLPTDFSRLYNLDLLLSSGVRQPVKSLLSLSQDSIAKVVVSQMTTKKGESEQHYYQVFAGCLHTYPRWIRSDSAWFELRYFAQGTNLDSASDTLESDPDFYNAVFWYACAEIQTKRYTFESALGYLKLTWALYGPPKGGNVQ